MEYEKIAETVSKNIDGTIRDNYSLKSILDEKSCDELMNVESKEESNNLKEFLDAPLGDESELRMRKIYAAATILAKQRGQLPDLPKNSHEIAAVIDEGLTRVKVNYQVGNGMIETGDAIIHSIERAESRAVSVIDKFFDSGKFEEYVTKGVVALTNCFPKVGRVIAPIAKHYAPVIKSVVARVKEPVRNCIKSGVHKVANYAKAGVEKIVEKANTMITRVTEKFLSFLS